MKLNIEQHFKNAKLLKKFISSGLLLCILLLLITVFTKDNNASLLNSIRKIDIVENAAHNINFQYLDKNNKSYTIAAIKGTQKIDNSFFLEEVQATYTIDPKTEVSIFSSIAHIFPYENKINLNKEVLISLNDKYSLKADAVEVDYKNSNIYATSNVELKSDFGIIISPKAQVFDDYSKAKFFGGRIYTRIINAQ